MRTVLMLPVLLALAACQSPDLGRYHVDAAHPYVLRETVARLPLNGVSPDEAARRGAKFGAERPNNGSSFVVSGPAELAEAVRRGLIAAGVDGRDIHPDPASTVPELVRIDRFASVANCQPTPTRRPGEETMSRVDDGYEHDNGNGALFGCSVRRNLAAQTDDPRTLMEPVHQDGRDGARAADVYTKWSKGQAPWGRYKLPTWSTSTVTSGDAQ